MKETGGSRLTAQSRQPPPPGPWGGPIVLAFQPLVVEEAGRPAADAGVLEAHHCSSREKLQGKYIDATTWVQIIEDKNSR